MRGPSQTIGIFWKRERKVSGPFLQRKNECGYVSKVVDVVGFFAFLFLDGVDWGILPALMISFEFPVDHYEHMMQSRQLDAVGMLSKTVSHKFRNSTRWYKPQIWIITHP